MFPVVQGATLSFHYTFHGLCAAISFPYPSHGPSEAFSVTHFDLKKPGNFDEVLNILYIRMVFIYYNWSCLCYFSE